MRRGLRYSFHLQLIAIFCSCITLALPGRCAQEPPQKSAEPTKEKPSVSSFEEFPAVIELLETSVHFEASGDRRKEVHTRIKINNELGARQFARLGFDYNRAFEQIEIPFVRITHPSGGTADILPSAITDQPNPAVLDAPEYQDVRVKTVRILGLAAEDILEYRVVASTSHHPLAPNFWFEHSFDRAGIVQKEIFDLDLPGPVMMKINPATPPVSGGGDIGGVVCTTRCVYHWERSAKVQKKEESAPDQPDVVLATFVSWQKLTMSKLAEFFGTMMVTPPEVQTKAAELTQGLTTPEAKSEALYKFVSQKIRTINLPPIATGFRTRNPVNILSSGYATPADKFALFAALSELPVGLASAALVSSAADLQADNVIRPGLLDHIVTLVQTERRTSWLDFSLDVAPYGFIPAQFRGKRALLVVPTSDDRDPWREISKDLPFAAKQIVSIDASLAADGALTSRIRYTMRGDNEILLRAAFRQTPKEKWGDVASLLALSDGFRGKVSNVIASDPLETKEPFSVGYEITQPQFIDWSKEPVRIPALLPQVSLPELPAKSTANAVAAIDLGTPLEVEMRFVLRLPPGTTARAPAGVSVSRDYAGFSSQYSANGETRTLFASRRIHFLLRNLPAERAVDYAAFRRAVQNDAAQDFTLERVEPQPAANSAATSAPPKSEPLKP